MLKQIFYFFCLADAIVHSFWFLCVYDIISYIYVLYILKKYSTVNVVIAKLRSLHFVNLRNKKGR
jgi:hypothetical protein